MYFIKHVLKTLFFSSKLASFYVYWIWIKIRAHIVRLNLGKNPPYIHKKLIFIRFVRDDIIENRENSKFRWSSHFLRVTFLTKAHSLPKRALHIHVQSSFTTNSKLAFLINLCYQYDNVFCFLICNTNAPSDPVSLNHWQKMLVRLFFW